MMTSAYRAGLADERPWGDWQVISVEDGYVIKRIRVRPHARLSLQRHVHRAEHWVIVAGEGLVTRDTETIPVRCNQSVFLPQGAVHRIENTGDVDLVFIEVQLGSLLSEDDIERLADDFGRS